MALAHSPSVVTNGLVFCVDAANPRSYPGSGSSWKDVSGSGINLISSGFGTFPTYQTNPPRLTFSTGYIGNNTSQSPLNITDNITVEAWVNQSSLVGFGGIIVFGTGSAEQWSLNSDATYGFNFGTNWPSDWKITYPAAGTATATNTWISVTVTFASGSTIWYVNGSLNNTVSQGISTLPAVSNAFVGVGDNFPGGQEYFAGSIGLLRVYNRVLTATEVTQNFNATRGRYGI